MEEKPTFGVFLVEGSNVERICRVDLPSGRDEGRRVLLLVDLVPVDALEERVGLQLLGAAAAAPQTHLNITLEMNECHLIYE